MVVCPGDDFVRLYPDRIAAYGLTQCRLSMLKLADPGFRLPAALMSDLSLRAIAAMPRCRKRGRWKRSCAPNSPATTTMASI